jgi:hypothetical protein
VRGNTSELLLLLEKKKDLTKSFKGLAGEK